MVFHDTALCRNALRFVKNLEISIIRGMPLGKFGEKMKESGRVISKQGIVNRSE
jgi:hypothetical protein